MHNCHSVYVIFYDTYPTIGPVPFWVSETMSNILMYAQQEFTKLKQNHSVSKQLESKYLKKSVSSKELLQSALWDERWGWREKVVWKSKYSKSAVDREKLIVGEEYKTKRQQEKAEPS